MDIVILSNFGGSYSIYDNDRFLYLANKLSKRHNVEIITSDFCHEKKEHRNSSASDWPFKITFLSEPGYKKNICLRRFFSHWIWGANVKKYLKSRDVPNVIYAAVPSLTGPFWASRFCKKNKVKFVIDIQDLWPEAFRMVFNLPIISSILFLPFKLLANRIYRNADDIIAVSQTYVDRTARENKKIKNGQVVYLGTELERFDLYSQKNNRMLKSENEIWIGYCGTLGSSYDLICVFDALNSIEEIQDVCVKLVVMGDGPLMSKFQDYVKKINVNVVFTGRIPYDEMCSLLKMCDIAVNPITHGAAQSIINKHADYVASGLPIVSTQENEEFKDLIESYNMGYNCKNNDSKELAEKIKKLIKDKDLREQMGINARRCAEECFDRKFTYKKIVESIEK